MVQPRPGNLNSAMEFIESNFPGVEFVETRDADDEEDSGRMSGHVGVRNVRRWQRRCCRHHSRNYGRGDYDRGDHDHRRRHDNHRRDDHVHDVAALRVETFRSIDAAFPDHVFDIEIKGSFPDALPVVEQLAAEIEELGRTDRVVVVSFDDQLLDAFHERAPDVAISPGLGRLTDWFLSAADLEPYFTILQVPPFQSGIEVVNVETVQRVHDEGRVVWVWADDASTQENADFYKILLDDGLDGIITGRPAAMKQALAG